jgi:hypothetical protein
MLKQGVRVSVKWLQLTFGGLAKWGNLTHKSRLELLMFN